MRSQNVLKNGIWGTVYQISNIFLGFVGRTIFIYFLSSDYLGISSLFSNILNLLSLSELGFSSAIAFHLYKPIAEKDTYKIVGIMNFYKVAYRIVAIFVLILGLSILPFLGFIIKESEFTLSYIRIIYILSIANTVSSYFFSYKYTLAIADQKNYILTNIDTIFRFINTIANIIVLIIFRDYIIYVTVGIVVNVFAGFIKASLVSKKYPYLKEKTQIEPLVRKKIMSDVKNIFAGKVSTVIVSSTDNILISAMISLKVVGLYSNYAMLIGYVQAFLTQFITATQASIGNMIASESKEYAYTVMKRLTVIFYFAVSFCSVCLFNLLNPFIELWIGESYLLDISVVGWCIASFYIQLIKTPIWYSLGGVGYFKEDRNISIIGAVSNLLISVICAYFYGLSGIFMGTVFSQLIQWILKTRLFLIYFIGTKCKEYYLLSTRLLLQTIFLCGLSYGITRIILIENDLFSFIIKMIVCFVVPNIFNCIIYRKSEAFQYIISLLKQILNKFSKKHKG
ncbi:hypothetical protein B5F08_11440 [Anaeromassilibacillus sp. An172]|uniref:lipopolysaccharide biosynthesis protein n=1 Tax=Anaeromassilibacillus sp. An172 TaxID=1965570 RepID=UPI000B3AD24C|nr:oligosaccharide flippase family protein [Anaeromassilibacillus sp. An172]OUP75321.1 hypothetical protein B5F08_11440 [Anaeromassilibacillus sp. An172]